MTSTDTGAPSASGVSWTLTLCAALGGFLFGYDTGIVNGAMVRLSEDLNFPQDSWQAGLVVASGIIGAFIGSAISGFVADTQGRRTAVIASDACFILGSTVLAFAPEFWTVVAARIVLGLGIGGASVVVPVYLAEITPTAWRGRVVTINNLFITGAQFISAIVAAICVVSLSVQLGWRVMFGLGALPALLQLILLCRFVPESPRWLWSRGATRHDEARHVAASLGMDMSEFAAVLSPAEGDAPPTDHARLVGATDSPHDVDAVNHGPCAPLIGVDASDGAGGFSFRALLAPSMRSRLLVGCGLQLCQQLSGINTVMYYSAAILKDSGVSGDVAPVLWSIPLAGMNAAGTIVGIFTVDRYGRRPSLLVSLLGCFVALVLFSVVSFLHSHIPAATSGHLSIVLLFLYLAAFSPGMGPVPWVVNSEIYPLHLRSAAAGAAAMTNWLSNAAVAQCFPLMMQHLGAGSTFAIVAVFVLASFGFVHRCVPETKGRSLEEIEDDLGCTKTEATRVEGA